MARLGRQRRIHTTYLRSRSVITPTPLVRNRVKVNESRRRAFIRATTRHRPILLRAPKASLVVFVRPNITVHKRRAVAVRPRTHIRLERAPLWSYPPKPQVIVHKRRVVVPRHNQARIIRPRVALVIPYVRPKVVVHTTSKTRAYRRRLNTIIVMGSVRGSAGVIPPPPTGGIPRKYRVDTFGFY